MEGKYYVWDYEDVERIVTEKFDLYSKYYQITKEGNWEGRIILNRKMDLQQFAQIHQEDEQKLAAIFDGNNNRLLEFRSNRIPPGLDNKIILGWNMLMNIGFCKAFKATLDQSFLEIAKENMTFMLHHFHKKEG